MSEPVLRRCLVVGHTSMIGQSIITQTEDSWRIITAGRRSADIYLDLADPLSPVEDAPPCDVAVVVAADFGGPSSEDFVRAELVNVAGIVASAKLAEAAGVTHLVLISSVSAIYDTGDSHFDAYALSKRHGEEAVSLFCSQRNIALTILRPTGVYDALGRARAHQPFLYSMIDQASAGRDITVYGSADPVRNFINTADVAQVVSRVIESGLQGTFTCPGLESLSIRQIARLVLATFGNIGALCEDSSRPDIATLPDLPATDLYRRLGWSPVISLRQGLLDIARSMNDQAVYP